MKGGVYMPILKSAIKKMRQDKKRKSLNKAYETAYQKAIANLKKGKAKTVNAAYRAIDKAAKKKIIHAKKASRLKAQAMKLVKKK